RPQIHSTITRCLERRIRYLSQARATPRFNQYLKTMLAFESRQRRRRRSKYSTLPLPVHSVQLLPQFETVVTHTPEIRSMHQKTRQRHEWRIRMILTVTKLFVVEPFVILCTCVSQSVVIWMIRLNQNSARSIAPAGAACDLRDQLKSSFR